MKNRLSCVFIFAFILTFGNSYGQKAHEPIEIFGKQWLAMDWGENTHNPGDNFWSADNVWTDVNFLGQEFLYLRLDFDNSISRDADSRWTCAQINYIGQEPITYGVYSIEFKAISGGIPDFAIFSPFLYNDHNDTFLQEVDIEFSRWSKWNYPNTQYSIHYDDIDGEPEWGGDHHFETDIYNYGKHKAIFDWQQDHIDFKVQSYINNVWVTIDERTFDGNQDWIPQVDDNMTFIINIWKDQLPDEYHLTSSASWIIEISDITFPTSKSGNKSNAADFKSSSSNSTIKKVETINRFEVSQNQPNPFTGETSIEVKTPKEEHVMVKVTDITGKIVYTMDAGTINGTQKITLTSDNMEAGIYFYTVTVGEESVTKKMIVE